MLHIRRVLFPTDRSSCAERAFVHASFLAQAHGAEIHALHIRRADAPEVGEGDLLPARSAEVARELEIPQGRQAAEIAPGDVVQNELVGDSPAEGIIGYAEENGIDLIVMGTHGRQTADRLLAGSVAERVVREAPCPVLTVRGDGSASIQRILVPVDFSDRSKSAIPVAEALAELYGASIELFYVIDEDAVPMAHVPLLGPVRVSKDEVENRFRELMKGLVREYGDIVPVTGSVRVGHPARDTLKHAEGAADLIVMSTHGRTGLERLFLGSVAEKIVRRAPCPVFTVKSFGQDLTAEA
jgi:nucleotide-binding universal stress UspA family protein